MWWMISVLSGSSVSTCCLRRRSMKGLITARSSAMCWGSFTALPKRRLNSPRLPSRPGLMKVNRLHSSPRWFSMGVPERARRKSPSSWNSSLARWVPAFLICCASSSTMLAQRRDLRDWARLPSMP
ncbi:hypothetical protein D3C75_541670 [compost metagenome]